MNGVKYCIVAACAAAMFSCNNVANKPDLTAMVNSMADIECRAVTLREQRFVLADDIRFAQDTLMHTSKDTMMLHNRLQAMNQQKQTLLQQSIALGDSIKHRLDSLMQNHLSDTAAKRQFSIALNDALVRKGCIDRE